MAFFPRGTIVHFECPTCFWQKAVLAYEQQGVGTAFCPHCQHVWDLAVPVAPVRAARRTTIPHQRVRINERLSHR
jgi:transcription elongation factor Elf1